MLTFLKKMITAIAFLQIAVSPLLIGANTGLGIVTLFPHTIGVVLAVLVTLVGLVLGIVWANQVNRKRGVVEHMSRVIATPELDKQED